MFFLKVFFLFGIYYVSLLLQVVTAYSHTNFKIVKVKNCPSEEALKFEVTNITNENNKQFIDLDVILPIPADENLGIVVDIKHAIDGKLFLPLFKISEKYCCKAAHAYLGEFAYDVERHMGIQPGVCPVQQGSYHLRHYELNFKNIGLQTFPFGRLIFKGNVINNKNSKSLLCVIGEVENLLN